jgi:hypothetical protein
LPERSFLFGVGKPAATESLIPLATHELQQQLQQEDAGATDGRHHAFVQLIHADAGAQFTCFPSAKVQILYTCFPSAKVQILALTTQIIQSNVKTQWHATTTAMTTSNKLL